MQRGEKFMKISVVIPCYKCEASIRPLYDRLLVAIAKLTSEFEIIFINDASPQNDWSEIKKIIEEDNKVIGINLSRNFGQHYAITAGLDYVTGDYVIVMDGDLQDQPEEIYKLYNKLNEGYDVVWARRKNRKDGLLKQIRAVIFFKIFDFLANTKTDPYTNTFSISRKNVVDNYKKINEKARSFTIFMKWLGFRQVIIDVEHAARYEGNSSYTIKRLLKLSADYILIYSNKPLKYAISIGLIMSCVSFIYGVSMIINKLANRIEIPGWTSIMVVLFFIGGLIIFNIGIVGIYIGKIFDEVKNRPIYIVKEVIKKAE